MSDSVLTLLSKSGNVTLGSIAAPASVNYAQRVFNALNNGLSEAVVLSHAGAHLADDLADAGVDAAAIFVNEDRKKGSTDYRDVASLHGMFERRNANNPSALDKTYGAVSIPASGGIVDPTTGECVGFIVESNK